MREPPPRPARPTQHQQRCRKKSRRSTWPSLSTRACASSSPAAAKVCGGAAANGARAALKSDESSSPSSTTPRSLAPTQPPHTQNPHTHTYSVWRAQGLRPAAQHGARRGRRVPARCVRARARACAWVDGARARAALRGAACVLLRAWHLVSGASTQSPRTQSQHTHGRTHATAHTLHTHTPCSPSPLM